MNTPEFPNVPSWSTEEWTQEDEDQLRAGSISEWSDEMLKEWVAPVIPLFKDKK